MNSPPRIALLLSDIDGTLVGSGKQLTPATIEAVGRLKQAGIAFTVTSSRPPRGLQHIIAALGIEVPVGAFNGGLLVRPDLSVLEARYLPAAAGRRVVDMMAAAGVDVWLFTDTEWFLINPAGPRVALERRTVNFEPNVVAAFPEAAFGRIGKIVGVSDDYDRLARCEVQIGAAMPGDVAASRSQPYYLDVTHVGANKGHVVGMLARALNIPAARIAAIGDGANDIPMLQAAGFGIAMGNAVDDLKQIAAAVTGTANDDGFAHAVDTIILPPFA
jgi:Cof subfamily protein (haloacid dehalogenase superfamily)